MLRTVPTLGHRSWRSGALAAVLALPLLGTLPACQSDGPKVDPEIQRQVHEEAARNHYRAADLDRAIDQALRALAIDDSENDMFVLVAKCYTRKGTVTDLLEAERIYIGLEKDDPEDSVVRLGVAIVSERIGQANMLRANDLEAGLDLPLGKDRDEEIARHRSEQERLFARAEDRYRGLLADQPEMIESLNGMTRICSLSGRTGEALDFANELVSVLKAQDEFYEEQLREQVMEESIEQRYRKLLRTTRVLLVDAHAVAADLHFQLDAPNLALGHLDRALDLDPRDSPDLYALRAQVQLALERPGRAIEDLDRFIASSNLPIEHPDVREAYRMRSDAQLALAAQDRP